MGHARADHPARPGPGPGAAARQRPLFDGDQRPADVRRQDRRHAGPVSDQPDRGLPARHDHQPADRSAGRDQDRPVRSAGHVRRDERGHQGQGRRGLRGAGHHAEEDVPVQRQPDRGDPEGHRRAGAMGAIGDMQKYMQYQAAKACAMRPAVRRRGGQRGQHRCGPGRGLGHGRGHGGHDQPGDAGTAQQQAAPAASGSRVCRNARRDDRGRSRRLPQGRARPMCRR